MHRLVGADEGAQSLPYLGVRRFRLACGSAVNQFSTRMLGGAGRAQVDIDCARIIPLDLLVGR